MHFDAVVVLFGWYIKNLFLILMPKTRRAFKGGFWNNDLASESEVTQSGRRIHRSRSYRKARRDSSRKKWKSRAWKAALASAALGTAYLGYKHRDAIANGYNTLTGINQGYKTSARKREDILSAQKQAAEEGLTIYDE